MNSNFIKAWKFCQDHHKGQFRKYTNEPFCLHPYRVMKFIENNALVYTTDMLCAALLHDLVEDTPVTLDQIENEFNSNVRNLVFYCSTISPPQKGMNRKQRKQIDLKHYASGPSEAQTIKIADIIDNVPSIRAHDPEFAKTYIKEKCELVEALSKADFTIREKARELLALT